MGRHHKAVGSHGGSGAKKGKGGVKDVVRLITIALTIAAVVKELRTPHEERTWHGAVVGFVPYDFRRPTLARIRERMWAPQDPRLVNPRVFGLGWTVNVGRLVTLVRHRVSAG